MEVWNSNIPQIEYKAENVTFSFPPQCDAAYKMRSYPGSRDDYHAGMNICIEDKSLMVQWYPKEYKLVNVNPHEVKLFADYAMYLTPEQDQFTRKQIKQHRHRKVSSAKQFFDEKMRIIRAVLAKFREITRLRFTSSDYIHRIAFLETNEAKTTFASCDSSASSPSTSLTTAQSHQDHDEEDASRAEYADPYQFMQYGFRRLLSTEREYSNSSSSILTFKPNIVVLIICSIAIS